MVGGAHDAWCYIVYLLCGTPCDQIRSTNSSECQVHLWSPMPFTVYHRKSFNGVLHIPSYDVVQCT